MLGKKKKEKEETTITLDDKLERQLVISKPGCQVTMVSNSRDDTMDYLVKRAIDIIDKYEVG